MITWKELKEKIKKEEGYAKRVPGVTQLSELGIPEIISGSFDPDCTIQVFENGLVSYHEGKRKVVFTVESCKKITYKFCDDRTKTIENSALDEEAWYLPLILEGNQKITDNCEDYLERKEIPVGEKEDVWDKFSWSPDFLHGVWMDTICAVLPERQREVFFMYVNGGYSVNEIAEITGTTRQNVNNRLKLATNRIKMEFF